MTIDTDIYTHMLHDLHRALRSTQAVQWAMVIDLNKCFGCHACTVACMAEKSLPGGLMLRPVHEEERGLYPQVSRHFTPRPCMHCLTPPCVPICPVQATFTQENGITHVDKERCIACGKCIQACPYGARVLERNTRHTAALKASSALVGHQDFLLKKQPLAACITHAPRITHKSKAMVHKCDFCWSRLQEKRLPTCVHACMAKATVFGNINDKDSLVSQWAASPAASRLQEEAGTQPQVIYLHH